MSDQLTPEEIKKLKQIVNPPKEIVKRTRILFAVFVIFVIVVIAITIVSMLQPIQFGVFKYSLN